MEFGVGYIDGFKDKITGDFLTQNGHIKIYNKNYYNKLDFAPVDYNIPFDEKLKSTIKSIKDVTSIRGEINFGAIANSIEKNQESLIKAIDLQTEGNIYAKRKASLIQGRFIENPDEVVMGYKEAELLNIKNKDKVILLGLDQYGGMNAVEATVVGIFKNSNITENESLIICSLDLAQQLLALENSVTEIIVNIKNPMHSKETMEKLKEKLTDNLIVAPWPEGQSWILEMLKMINVSMFIIGGIIIFVASLGISNSFLMNMMGRLPEFGVKRAMGVSKTQIFSIILSESFLLGLIGTIIGLIFGIGLVYYFQVNPISYEEMSKTFDSLGGMDSLIGTALIPSSLAFVFIIGILISILASLYPAFMVIHKKPVDILRVLE